MLILEDLLSVNRINHASWQDADSFVVTNIFTLFEQMGNCSLSEVVDILFGNKEVMNNATLQCFNFATGSELDLLESVIDNYIESGLMMHDPSSMRSVSFTYLIDEYIEAHQVLLYLIAICGIRLHFKLQQDENYNSYVNSLMKPENVATIVAKKQKDYGPSNVSKFGIYGLIVRTHDKIGRLKNLLSSSRKAHVQDETIFDTLIDLVGYSVISMLWINNWFTIPMANEYDWSEIKTKKFSYI